MRGAGGCARAELRQLVAGHCPAAPTSGEVGFGRKPLWCSAFNLGSPWSNASISIWILKVFFKRSLIWLVHKQNWQLRAIEFVTKRLLMLKISRAVVSKAQLGAAYLEIVCVACAPFTSPLLARGLVQLLVGLLLIAQHTLSNGTAWGPLLWGWAGASSNLLRCVSLFTDLEALSGGQEDVQFPLEGCVTFMELLKAVLLGFKTWRQRCKLEQCRDVCLTYRVWLFFSKCCCIKLYFVIMFYGIHA